MLLYNTGHGAAVDLMAKNLIGPSLSVIRSLSQAASRLIDIPRELTEDTFRSAQKWCF